MTEENNHSYLKNILELVNKIETEKNSTEYVSDNVNQILELIKKCDKSIDKLSLIKKLEHVCNTLKHVNIDNGWQQTETSIQTLRKKLHIDLCQFETKTVWDMREKMNKEHRIFNTMTSSIKKYKRELEPKRPMCLMMCAVFIVSCVSVGVMGLVYRNL